MNLKITLSLFSVFFLVAAESLAQKHPQLQYISLDAGLNLSGIRSAGHYDNHARNLGARISLSVNYSLCNSKSVGTSLSFEQKGATDPVHKINTNLNYLTIPVYFKFTAGKDPKFYFMAGSYFSSLVSASRKGDLNINGNTTTVNNKVTAEFNRFDAGLAAGCGIGIKLYDNLDLMISTRISSGLIKIEDIPGERPRNYQINISTGYIYYIGFR